MAQVAASEVTKVHIEFSGGLELLFEKRKQIDLAVPLKEGFPLKDLLKYIRDKELKERPELFMQEETIRPGILILINEVDWELEGGIDYKVQNGDSIVFISTLHGG